VDYIWQYTFPNAAGTGSPVNGTLTPIFTTVLGAETTSPFWHNMGNGMGYLSLVTQHPYGESDNAWGAMPTSSGAAAYMGVIGPIPIPTCTPSPPPPAAVVVSATMTLNGLTVAQFNTAAQTAFKSALATQLSISSSQIAITSVTAAGASGRHLLQSSIVVAFSVTTTSSAAATSVSSGITDAASSSTFLTALNTQLVAAGAPTVTSLVLSTTPTVLGAPPAAAPSSPAPARGALGVAATLAAATTVMLALL
jgi:hypothetical protein